MWRTCRALLLATVLAAGCGGGSPATGTAGTTGAAGTSGTGGATGTAGSGGTVSGTAGAAGGRTCSPLLPGSGISEVNGPQVGAAVAANSALRKTIAATDTSSNPMISVTGAWLVDPTMRASLSLASSAYAIFALASRASVPLCGVAFRNLVFRDAAGAKLDGVLAMGPEGQQPSVLVAGGIAMDCTASADLFTTCLAAGESSFASIQILFSSSTIADTPIVGADFTLSATTDLAYAQPNIQLAVQSYTVDTVDVNTPQRLNMTILNPGTRVARFRGLSWFLLDAQGAPLATSYIVGPSTTLRPSENFVATDSALQFDGAGSRVYFSVWPP